MKLKRISVTEWIVIANVIVYTITAIASFNFFEINEAVLDQVGLTLNTLIQGKFWVFISSMFAHLNLPHLTSNMFIFIILGVLFEDQIGRRTYLTVYFISGVAGNILSLIIVPTSLSVGASAAIFGIMGASMVRKIESIIFGTLLVLFLFALIPDPNVNVFAHGIGATVGVITDQFITWYKNRQLTQQRKIQDLALPPEQANISAPT